MSQGLCSSNNDYPWRDNPTSNQKDSAWLAQYPQEVGQIFNDKVCELRLEAQSLRRSLARKVRFISENETDEFAGWFAKEWLKASDAAKIAELEAKVAYFKRLLSISSDGPSDWDRIVTLARETPILDIVGSDCRLRRSGKSYVAKCPLHEERTPSFHIYPDQGTFHCFGCGAHGDVITYTMLRNQLNFKGAVQMLAGGRL